MRQRSPLWMLTLSASIALLATLPGGARSVETDASPAIESVETRSELFTVDRVYKSMFGPIDYAEVTLSSETTASERRGRPEVVWITGIRADIVDSADETQSPEYFCHSNLRLASSQPMNRLRIFGREKPNKKKLFTLVQGQTEIRFPPGFGMPVLSNDHFASQVMVMSPTQPEQPVEVGVRSRRDFVHHRDLTTEMKPLYVVSLILQAPIESQETALLAAEHEHADGSCLDGESHSEAVLPVDLAPTGRRKPTVFEGAGGEKRTTMWYVPPGRHVYRYQLERLGARIREPTRAHYISAHLHPFGESIELIDLTTGESVFKSTAENYPDRVALREITHYSSVEGTPIDPSHDYELVAVYDNTSGEDVDSMAVMYLYLHDRSLKLRNPARGS
jgi:hypothetical protein